ncbi:Metallo-dependent hydrolase [Phaeosphaeriaceae sp. SRC1lsM3a]|nr:Metallo-dependent hydrolase [Stagonospora sp. SRC1lsM3a]
MQYSLKALLALASHAITFADAGSVLFTDATIITFNANSSKTNVLHGSSLLVEGDRIQQIFDGITPNSYPNGTEVVNATGKIISPGFINTHHHLWQTAYRTIASNTTLAEYFIRYGAPGPSTQYFTAEDKYLSQLTGSIELMNSGTTTVLDHAHGDSSNETADAIFTATLDSKLRTYHAFAIQTLPNNYTTTDQMYKLAEIAADPRLADNDLVKVSLAYDSFDAAPSSVISHLWSLVQSLNLSLVTTHSVGGPWILGNTPSKLNSLGWLNTSVPVVFSHASFITASDIAALRQTNQYISTTPESEMHYGHSHPSAKLIQDQAALGVDTHFTFSADMVGQARLWLQKLRLERFEEPLLQRSEIPRTNPMSVQQAFHLMTRAGALALRNPEIGAIAPGMKADLVIFDGESPNMLGWSDAIAAIVLHSNVGDIEGVLVGGEWVKKVGKMTHKGYADVKRRFLASAKRIQNIWAETDWPEVGAEGEAWQGITPYGDVRNVDVMRGEGTGY